MADESDLHPIPEPWLAAFRAILDDRSNKWSQSSVARALKVSRQVINKIYLGKQEGSHLLFRISVLLEIPPPPAYADNPLVLELYEEARGAPSEDLAIAIAMLKRAKTRND